MGDIPNDEMITILEHRCGCPLSHAKLLVKVLNSLQVQRSKTNVFQGKNGLITPRDLLRWAERHATTKEELAFEGYALLAERLRNDDEKEIVKSVLEEVLKTKIDVDKVYYDEKSEPMSQLSLVREQVSERSERALRKTSLEYSR